MAQITFPFLSRNRRRTRTYDVASDNVSDIVAAVIASITPTGSIVPTLSAADPGDGWILCDGRAVSKADFPDLYAAIGNKFGETTQLFNLPNLAGRGAIGFSAGIGAIGDLVGRSEVALSAAEMPSHTHQVNDPGHSHTFTGQSHTHAVTDPGHAHGITDPGHAHTAAIVAQVGSSGGDDGAATGATLQSQTNISINEAATGISIAGAAPGGTVGSATSGLSIASAGQGQAFSITPPSIVANWIIKT